MCAKMDNRYASWKKNKAFVESLERTHKYLEGEALTALRGDATPGGTLKFKNRVLSMKKELCGTREGMDKDAIKEKQALFDEIDVACKKDIMKVVEFADVQLDEALGEAMHKHWNCPSKSFPSEGRDKLIARFDKFKTAALKALEAYTNWALDDFECDNCKVAFKIDTQKKLCNVLAYGIPILTGNELQDAISSVSDLATIHAVSEQLDLSTLFVKKSKKGKSLSVLWKDANNILNYAVEQILKDTWEAMQGRREYKTVC